jgi:hypothetical protein
MIFVKYSDAVRKYLRLHELSTLNNNKYLYDYDFIYFVKDSDKNDLLC